VSAYLVRPGPPAFTLHLPARDNLGSRSVASGRVALRPGYPDGTVPASHLSIGTLQIPPPEVLGSIEDALVDHLGGVIVLDGQAAEVRLFNSHGQWRGTVGGRGRGPGEFVSARAIALGPQRRLWVFDGRGMVSAWEPVADSMRLLRSFSVGGEVYVHGVLAGRHGVIHTFTADGTYIRSFGQVYRSRNPIINYQLSRGRLACAPASQVVLLAPQILPEVRAYSPDGVLLWWASVEGFRTLEAIELPTGGTMLRTPDAGGHLVTALVTARDGDDVLLQVTTTAKRSENEPDTRRFSFRLNINERFGTKVDWGVGRVLDWGSDLVLMARDRPYPRVSLFRTGKQ
jgi:hypothetical protein